MGSVLELDTWTLATVIERRLREGKRRGAVADVKVDEQAAVV
jgi:glutamate transport system permease protein